VEQDRTADTDCLVLDFDAGPSTTLLSPAADASGNLYVLGSTLDEPAGSWLSLWRLSASGAVQGPLLVGRGTEFLPPMVVQDRLYVAFSDGVMRYATGDLSEQGVIPAVGPQAALAATGGSPLAIVAVPVKGGKLVLYDETETRSWTPLDLPTALRDPGLASDRWLPPVISGSGRRLYLATAAGRLVGVEIGKNPVGPTASLATGRGFLSAPVEWGGRVFGILDDSTLRAYREQDQTFEEVWSVTLAATPAGGLLVNPDGAVVLALTNGDVVQVTDRGSSAEVVVLVRFAEGLGPYGLIWSARPRLLALTASSPAMVSAVRSEDGGWAPGLRFDLSSAVTAAPILAGGRLLVPLASGRLRGWALPEGVPGVGFVLAGGDAGGTRRVRSPAR